MNEQVHCHEREDGMPGAAEFLAVIGELRDEVHSMGTDMREVLRENEELKEELSRLRRRGNERPRSDMRRIKRECLDGLERLQELASMTRRSRGSRTRDDDTDEPSSGAWMKKMMMVMMMADLV